MRKASVVVVVLMILAIAVAAGAAWRGGYQLFAIRTGSMAPTYPTGALVLEAPPTASPPLVGSVVTFRVNGSLVTHRVVASTAEGITTKGDANRTPDAWTVPAASIEGRVIAGAPRLGYVAVFFKQPSGVIALVAGFWSVVLLWGFFFPAPVVGLQVAQQP